MSGKPVTYETLGKITDAISSSADLDDVSEHVVHSLKDALSIKGCALLLLDRSGDELKLAASHGLSQDYLEKGPLSAAKSIADSLSEGPVVINDVEDDPRIQYPDEAVKEGIKSIMSFPMVLRGRPLGALRLYSAEPWEAELHDIAILQAISLLVALVIDNIKVQKGLQASIDVLKVLRQPARPTKRTLYE